MNVRTTITQVSRNLSRAPARSALTSLGVIVGAAAVVATLSIGNGARERMKDALTQPNSRTIYLVAAAPPSRTSKSPANLRPADRLTSDDYMAIRDSVRHTVAVSPLITLSPINLQANGQSIDGILDGIDRAGFSTTPRHVLAGTLFGPSDVQKAQNVCVVSHALARFLFQNGVGVGMVVRINYVPFIVIGIVDDPESIKLTNSGMPDYRLYVPYTSLLRRLNSNAPIAITVQAKDVEHVHTVEQSVRTLIENRRNGRKTTFITANSADTIRAYTQGSIIVARLLAAFGAISLVVGGIGIMNIMLVSVAERTREIGVRLAVGTRRRGVLSQFLAEAVVLSLFGGCIGIILGIAATWLVAGFNDWPTATTFSTVLIAFLCSCGVGIVFGYEPARRAVALDPAEALIRRE